LLDPLHSWWRYDEMVPDEPLHFPVVPHRSAGVDCVGCIVPETDGDEITLKCNECGAVVGTIDVAILKALTQAISDSILVHKFDELDAPEAPSARRASPSASLAVAATDRGGGRRNGPPSRRATGYDRSRSSYRLHPHRAWVYPVVSY
jgi:hypothetical protein